MAGTARRPRPRATSWTGTSASSTGTRSISVRRSRPPPRMARRTERSSRPLSKSKYLTGFACHRLVWHEVHAGDLPELAPDLEAQFRMEQGNAVQARARAEFPGGVLVASPDFATEQRLEETARAL